MNEGDFLSKAIAYGMLSADTISDIEEMIKKKEVLKHHKAAISQGKGKDTRWFTYIPDATRKNGRLKVAKQTEKEMYDYLYRFYSGEVDSDATTIKTIYPLWREYKRVITNRENTVYRIDLDWKKYYLNEPLSEELINKPIDLVTRADIRRWAHQLIKKYEMTRKKYMNVQTILRQIFQYMIDKEELDKNPMDLLKIDRTAFRTELKKPAETQIFYQDEIEQIVAKCREMAANMNDASYLAIPLFFLTGMRIGEILALGFEDFDNQKSSVYIHRSLCVDVHLQEDGTWSKRQYEIQDHLKKNAEPRTILVPKQVFDLVREVKKIQMRKGAVSLYLFPAKTPHVVTGKLYRICDELEIRRRSPHKCRKTYISNLLNKGIDADFVREQAGHRELQTTLNCYAYSTTRNEEKVAQLQAVLAL